VKPLYLQWVRLVLGIAAWRKVRRILDAMGLLVAMGALVFAIAGLFARLSRPNLSAIQQPGRAEEYLRSKITRVR